MIGATHEGTIMMQVGPFAAFGEDAHGIADSVKATRFARREISAPAWTTEIAIDYNLALMDSLGGISDELLRDEACNLTGHAGDDIVHEVAASSTIQALEDDAGCFSGEFDAEAAWNNLCDLIQRKPILSSDRKQDVLDYLLSIYCARDMSGQQMAKFTNQQEIKEN